MSDDSLKYPIGTFKAPTVYNPQNRTVWITDFKLFPEKLKYAISKLTNDQLDHPYRPDGWSTKKLIHHTGDVYMQSYIRFKHALTEQNPTIKSFDQNAWSLLANYDLPAVASVLLIESLQPHMSTLLSSIEGEKWQLTFTHPLYGYTITLEEALAMYAWHLNHHLAQINNVKFV